MQSLCYGIRGIYLWSSCDLIHTHSTLPETWPSTHREKVERGEGGKVWCAITVLWNLEGYTYGLAVTSFMCIVLFQRHSQVHIKRRLRGGRRGVQSLCDGIWVESGWSSAGVLWHFLLP